MLDCDATVAYMGSDPSSRQTKKLNYRRKFTKIKFYVPNGELKYC